MYTSFYRHASDDFICIKLSDMPFMKELRYARHDDGILKLHHRACEKEEHNDQLVSARRRQKWPFIRHLVPVGR